MSSAFDSHPSTPTHGASPGSRGDTPGRSGQSWAPPEEGLAEQLLKLVRRRKWIILQAFVVVVAAALLLSLRQSEEYTATASLLFVDASQGVVGSSSTTVDPTRDAATNAALVKLPQVADYASRELNGAISAQEIHSSVTVDTGSNDSNLVTIQAVTGSPERSAEIANAYGRGYIEFRRNTDRAALNTSIQQLEADLAALPADQQAGREGDRLRGEITSLQAASALRTGGAELVQPATPPASPSAPNTRRNLLLAAIVGLVLGLLIAALVDRLDQRVRSVDDLSRLYGLPVLAEIPRNRRIGDGRLRSDVDVPEAEPFRMLRTNLRYLGFNRQIRSMLVLSPMRGDGKSTIARSLATTMAAMGDHVVLVEADMHAHHVDPPAQGLVTVLMGESLEDALLDLPVSGAQDHARALTVLPAGPPPPNPSELLDSEQMRTLLLDLEEHFDFVIVDGPATTSVSDSLALVPIVSGVLVVGGLGKTTTKTARDLRQQIGLLDGHPIGLAANFAPAPPNGYGYRS